MPRGVFETPRRRSLLDKTQVAIAKDKLIDHDRELRAQGHDPEYIGVTEVAPVCCPSCSKPIPWKIIKAA